MTDDLRATDAADAAVEAVGHDGEKVILSGAVFTPWSLAALEDEILTWRNLHPDLADDDDDGRWR